MKIESPAFADGERIPERHSAYGENRSPELRWGGAPADTKSFAISVDDPDAPGAEPFVHWLIYNIPSSMSSLPEGLPTAAKLPEMGALQGRNSAGSVGYFGPRPPKTHPPHHYHFRIVALDGVLPLDAGVERQQLSRAMEGHTLAEAETVGVYGYQGA